MDAVERLIGKIGGHVTRPCYRYLVAAVRYALELEEFPRGRLTKQFYPTVARSMGYDGKAAGNRVGRGIARATEDIWTYGNRERLRELAEGEWRGKPSPGELIYYLREYLAEEQAGEQEIERAVAAR